MDELRLVAENERLLRDVAALRERVRAFEQSHWWRLHPRFLLRRRVASGGRRTKLADSSGEYHRQLRAGSARSAAVVAPVVQELVGGRSIADVGGGEGWWAAAFVRLGATAVSIDTAPLSARAPGIGYVEHDLQRPLGHELDHVDLAVCLEVVEHLEPAVGDRLVTELCALAPAVLFSAAIPGQGGVGHVNEQWPSYWVERFARNGFRCSGALRWWFWCDERVESWYRQNLLFATSEPGRYPTLFETPLAEPWPVVHPATHARGQADTRHMHASA